MHFRIPLIFVNMVSEPSMFFLDVVVVSSSNVSLFLERVAPRHRHHCLLLGGALLHQVVFFPLGVLLYHYYYCCLHPRHTSPIAYLCLIITTLDLLQFLVSNASTIAVTIKVSTVTTKLSSCSNLAHNVTNAMAKVSPSRSMLHLSKLASSATINLSTQ